jgi:outer membrane protein OmpA-like peptidoglycan-associated protein
VNPVPQINYGQPPPDAARHLRYGVVVTFEQTWQGLGLALGDLLYSVPLAPCEEVKLATVDWRAEQRASKQAGTTESATEDSSIVRNRSVNNVAQTQSKKQAEQSQISVGLSAGVQFGPFGANLSAGFSHSWGSELTEAAARSSQNLNDQIEQISAAQRDTQSFAVVEVSQAEQNVVSTRTVRNHNHCHTLTFQYYEVLQRYLVQTTPAGLDPVILVPFQPVVFGPDEIDKYGDVLRRWLRDPALLPFLDDWIGRRPASAPTTAPTTPTTDRPDPTTGLLRLTLTVPDHPDFPDLADGEPTWLPAGRQYLSNYIVVRTPGGVLADPHYHRQPEDHHVVTGVFVLPTPMHLSELAGLQVANTAGDLDRTDNHWNAHFDAIQVETYIGGTWVTQFMQRNVRVMPGAPVDVLPASPSPGAPSPGTPTPPPPPTSSPVPAAPAPQLVAHLRANAFYYTSAIVRDGDPVLLWALFSQIHDDNNNFIADIVLPELVGLVGFFAAFRLTLPDYLPDEILNELPDGWRAADAYAGSRPAVVVLPTPGTFAESQLGSCGACETKDDTVFWRWQEAPCDGAAPDITSDMLQSRFKDASTLLQFAQSSLTPSPVQIPDAPGLIQISDATLAELSRGLNLNSTDGLHTFLSRLAELTRGSGASSSSSSAGSDSSGSSADGSSSSNSSSEASSSGDSGNGSGNTSSPGSSSSTTDPLRGTQDRPWIIDNFRLDQSDLPAATTVPEDVLGSGGILTEIADYVLERRGTDPGFQIHIEGHTDHSGSEGHNESLAQNRATTVARALASRGVPGDAMLTTGFGETRPREGFPDDAQGRNAYNRRVEVWHP